MDNLKTQINDMNNLLKDMDEQLEKLKSNLVGKKVRIISETWNGQAHGYSKPKLYGKIFTITSVFISQQGTGYKIHIFTGGDRCSIELNDVQILDDDNE